MLEPIGGAAKAEKEPARGYEAFNSGQNGGCWTTGIRISYPGPVGGLVGRSGPPL